MDHSEPSYDHDGPRDCEADRARGAAFAHEGDSDCAQDQRHGEAPQPEEPPEQGLDAATDGAGKIEVDRQAKQYRRTDQTEPDQFVTVTPRIVVTLIFSRCAIDLLRSRVAHGRATRRPDASRGLRRLSCRIDAR